MLNIPVLISALCVTLYWITVIVKSFRLARKIGKDPNVFPRDFIGKITRLIWTPTIIVWMVLLWRGIFAPTQSLANFAAVIVILATALTFWCWKQMGKSWRIGIDPNEKTQLIISGPYRYVLHPIYSLSMALALGTLLTLPTFAMLATVFIHLVMLNIESRREENYLLRVHGETYRNYQKSVGRFFPLLCQCKE